MITHVYRRRTRIPAQAEEVYDWHLRPGAFERLTPPFAPAHVIHRDPELQEGSRVELQVPFGPIPQHWMIEHHDFVAGRQFCDRQVAGPFASFRHVHRFVPDGPEASYLEDDIAYVLPLGRTGETFGASIVHRMLDRMFTYRHNVTLQDLAYHRTHKAESPMKILVTGSSGLIGRSLIPLLTTGGHQVKTLVRKKPPEDDTSSIYWNPENGTLNFEQLEGFDAVVHLAAEGIADGRWSAAKKERIRSSRVAGTRLLSESLAKCVSPPKTLLSGSATGFYGNRGAEFLDDNSAPGRGFLPELCREWEDATEPARQKGVRVVLLRTGVVLTPAGGALSKMLTPFKMGVGGVLGSGEQYMSWISLDDEINAILHALLHSEISGPINLVSPEPVTNREFTKTLGKVLNRPTIFPMPGFVARLAFGEMADDLLLGGCRVFPKRLQESGYPFRHPTLEVALRHVLGIPKPELAIAK